MSRDSSGVLLKTFSVGLVVASGVLIGTFGTLWVTSPDYVDQAIRAKLDGQLPELTWAQVVFGFPGSAVQGEWMSWVSLAESGSGPCPAKFETPVGEFWGRNEDGPVIDFMLKEQMVKSAYSWGAVKVEPGDVVLDVGGHLGTFARLAFRDGATTVIAFEPEPTNIKCLKETFVAEIASGKYLLVEAAAWESEGTLKFSVPHSSAGFVTEDGEIEVDAVTVDGVAEKFGLDRVDFIKMDIEGAERNALLGARLLIDRFAPKLALCTYHRADDPTAIPNRVRELNPRYTCLSRSQQVYCYPKTGYE